MYKGVLESIGDEIVTFAQVTKSSNVLYDKEEDVHYLKLGADAQVDTVSVYYKDINTIPLSRYTDLIHGADSNV